MDKLSDRAIRELSRELGRLRQLRDRINDTIAGIEATLADCPPPAERPEGEPKQLRNAIHDLLREVGEPLHYREMLARLQERGVAINGKSPTRTLSAHLSNDFRFLPVGDGKWGLEVWRMGTP